MHIWGPCYCASVTPPTTHTHTHTHTHTQTTNSYTCTHCFNPHSSSSGLMDGIQGVLQRHQKMQDDIAEDMICMARSLRDNSLIAKDIIIGDNKVSGNKDNGDGGSRWWWESVIVALFPGCRRWLEPLSVSARASRMWIESHEQLTSLWENSQKSLHMLYTFTHTHTHTHTHHTHTHTTHTHTHTHTISRFLKEWLKLQTATLRGWSERLVAWGSTRGVVPGGHCCWL